MSYILEALRKAETEREREHEGVPDLHAQRDAGSLRERLAAEARLRRAWQGAAAVGAIAVGTWAWLAFTEPAPAPAAAAALAMPPAPAPAPTPALAPSAATPAILPLAAAAPTPSLPQAPAAAAPRSASKAPQKAVAAASSPARIGTMAELPADVRAQLPVLSVGGSMYSSHAPSRLIIIGGQIFREGDQPVPGLVVEKIGLKSTLLGFRGHRFELPH